MGKSEDNSTKMLIEVTRTRIWKSVAISAGGRPVSRQSTSLHRVGGIEYGCFLTGHHGQQRRDRRIGSDCPQRTPFTLYARLAQIAGVPFENCELMGILRYAPGQEYFPHHDYLPEDAADYSEVKRSGQRIRTLLITLNDDYDGGETAFPVAGMRGYVRSVVVRRRCVPVAARYSDPAPRSGLLAGVGSGRAA